MWLARVAAWDNQWNKVRGCRNAREAAHKTVREGDQDGALALNNKTVTVEVREELDEGEAPIQTFDVECMLFYNVKEKK